MTMKIMYFQVVQLLMNIFNIIRGVRTGGAGGAIAPPIILRNFVKYFSV